MATDIGTGTTFTFGTSGFSFDLLNVDWSGIAREAINTSHMGTTTSHTKMPTDLKDSGQITLEGAFIGNLDPPLNGAAETVTIDYAGEGAGYRWSASAFIVGFDITAPLEDKMTFSMTLEVTGNITIS